MGVQVDPELLVRGLLADALADVRVSIEHDPEFQVGGPLLGLQCRVLPGGILRRHTQSSHYDVELIGWGPSRAAARSVCARALDALRIAWARQLHTSLAPGALANFDGGVPPFQQRLPGMPATAFRFTCTAALGIRTPGTS